MSVVTAAEAKAHLNLSGATPDEEVAVFIASAEAAIARRVGPLDVTQVTERVDGGQRLVLRWPHALTLVSVTPVGGSPLTLADLYLQHGVIESNSGQFGSPRYDVVYSTSRGAETPADLRLAVLELVRHFWDTRRGNAPAAGGALPDEQMPGMSQDMYYALPRRVEQLLAPFALGVV